MLQKKVARLSSIESAKQQQVQDALIKVRDSDDSGSHRLYAVIDPILVNPYSNVPNLCESIALPSDKFAASDCPYLLRLSEFGRDPVADETVARSIAEVGRIPGDEGGRDGRQTCGWVVIDGRLPIRQAAREYARRSQVVINSARRTFRFWDPRILDLAKDLLTESQLRALFAPAASWSWLSRQGDLKTLTFSRNGHDVDHAYGLNLNEEQRGYLSRLPEINLVLDSLAVARLDSRTVKSIYIARKLAEAEHHWRLHDRSDQVSYAICCSIYGGSFSNSPEIRDQLIAGVKSNQSPMEAIGDLMETLECVLPPS